ncbi:protein FAM45A-like [Cimex lectularius]|uniref:UDENN domain-containing protein n=1 Tax=Cimex lectularius TaxID=79782 RepID=A0A8I6RUZ2_CIMLE|nr:protein FAM45A-like [Cimex lectularius]
MTCLLAYNIIEKGNDGDVLWSWAFPSLKDEQRKYIEDKCHLSDLKFSLYGKFKNWFYIHVTECNQAILPNIENIGIVVWAKDFKPDQYLKLASLLSRVYNESGDPTKVLQFYLSVVTKDITPNNNGSLLFKEFCSQKTSKSSRIKELIKMFGLEVILIYNTLLLEKRLIVYHHSLPVLLEWLKSFPYFIAHRKIDDHLIPWFEVNDQDISELRSRRNYIAGCCDNSVFLRSDLYDVLVNLPAKEITISPQSKDKLPVTKTHKDIALFMEQLADSEMDEEKVVSSITAKTKELISLIRSMSVKGEDMRDYISLEKIKERNFSPVMENFIVQLASTENIYFSNN